MFLLYSILFSIGVLLTAPYYLLRYTRKADFRTYWRERLGFLPPRFQQPTSRDKPGAIWVHAVSVGETLAVVGLVREVQQRYPDRQIFISHVTPTGREAGETRLPGVAGRVYLPLDWGWAVRQALRRLRPELLLIVETELWPNLLRAAHEFGSRVVLANARLSDRSFRGYRLFRPFFRRVLENIDRILAQTQVDAERFRQLGAGRERVWVTGNLKFDGHPPQLGQFPTRLKRALDLAHRGPIMVAASTMPGEERLLLRTWQQILSCHPRALLILAPRHPARFEQVAQLLADEGHSFVRRTALETADEELASQVASPEILLVNTVGELAGIFEVGDVAFIGGSLVPTGGHNLLEPAFCSKPIVFGPHMQNFRDAADLFLRANAAVQVRDSAELAVATLHLLENATRRRELGERAKQVLQQESGATRRVLEHLCELRF